MVTMMLLVVLTGCPWSWCQPPLQERPVRSSEVTNAAWGLGIAVDPDSTRTNPDLKLVCDFSDREARTWAHWRDFDLHSKHEDRDGAFCESHQLWTTWTGPQGGAGEGFFVSKAGVGAYGRGVCAPYGGDAVMLKCEESRKRAASACAPDAAWVVEDGQLRVKNFTMSAPPIVMR